MRKRIPTNGKVAGAKFALNKENEENDLKKVKEQLLKEIAQSEADKQAWYDKEMEKNLKKQ